MIAEEDTTKAEKHASLEALGNKHRNLENDLTSV
jgi:hypothetical protein